MPEASLREHYHTEIGESRFNSQLVVKAGERQLLDIDVLYPEIQRYTCVRVHNLG